MSLDSIKRKIARAFVRFLRPYMSRASKWARTEMSTIPSSRDTYFMDNWLRAYCRNPWVYGAIKARCDAGILAEFKFYSERYGKDDSGAPEIIKTVVTSKRRPLLKAFERPNPWMSTLDLLESIFAFLLLDGNAFFHYNEENGEIWPMLPGAVSIKKDPDLYIKGYIYNPFGIPVELNREDVFHIKMFNPFEGYFGMSPVMAVLDDLELDASTKKYLKAFFRQGARLSGIVEVPEDADEDEIEALQKKFDDDHAGSANMHRVVWLGKGYKYVKSGMTNQELQIEPLAHLSRDSVMAIWRTPPALLGRWEAVRFSNAREQVRLFYESVQIPLWMKIGAQISAHERVYDLGLRARFDWANIEVLREADTDKAERGRVLIQSGQWTQNEVRDKLWNMPPKPGGDELLKPKTGRNVDLGKNPKSDDNKKGQDQEQDQDEGRGDDSAFEGERTVESVKILLQNDFEKMEKAIRNGGFRSLVA